MEHTYLIIILLLLGLFLTVVRLMMIHAANVRVKNNIFSRKFIAYQDFERNWISHKAGRSGVAGYKYNDTSGCYIILIFNKPVVNGHYRGYEDIYIGQSVNICKRVHNHFNGKGNGDVYADIKYGKSVYVQFVPCKKEALNRTEKKLIEAFNATQSYNNTRGGAKIV